MAYLARIHEPIEKYNPWMIGENFPNISECFGKLCIPMCLYFVKTAKRIGPRLHIGKVETELVEHGMLLLMILWSHGVRLVCVTLTKLRWDRGGVLDVSRRGAQGCRGEGQHSWPQVGRAKWTDRRPSQVIRTETENLTPSVARRHYDMAVIVFHDW